MGKRIHAYCAPMASPFDAAGPLRIAAQPHFTVTGPADAPSSHEELWEALVSGRWTLLRHRDGDGVRSLLLRRNAPRQVRPLAPREREVVRRVAMGQANKAIAIELGISLGSVSSSLSVALRKMGIGTRSNLVALAAVVADLEAA